MNALHLAEQVLLYSRIAAYNLICVLLLYAAVPMRHFRPALLALVLWMVGLQLTVWLRVLGHPDLYFTVLDNVTTPLLVLVALALGWSLRRISDHGES